MLSHCNVNNNEHNITGMGVGRMMGGVMVISEFREDVVRMRGGVSFCLALSASVPVCLSDSSYFCFSFLLICLTSCLTLSVFCTVKV